MKTNLYSVYQQIVLAFLLFAGIFANAGNGANSFPSSGFANIEAEDHSGSILSPDLKGTTFQISGIITSNQSVQNSVITSYSISGIVSNADPILPLEGVTLTFVGLGTVTTNSSGYYVMAVPNGWSGTVTPSFCDFSFSPSVKTYINVKSDKPNENYAGSNTVNYSISGVVTYASNGQPFANKGISFGNGYTVVTNSSGQYELELPSCWNGTLTPSSNGVNFNPASRSYGFLQQNYFNQNFQVSNPPILRPPNWDYPNTGVVHIISLQYTSVPDVCSELLLPGDWIGTFFKNAAGEFVCAGAAQWTGSSSNIALLPQGDDPYTTEKDGFAYGESFNWRLYRWSDSTEHVAYVTYQTGTGMSTDNKFYSNGLSLVSAIDGYQKLDLSIPEGWSGFSCWFNPPSALKPVNTLLQPIISNLEILLTLTKMYYPAQNINTIGNWNTRAGYEIKVTDTVTLPFYGCLETNRTVAMAAGWNLLPVLTPCEIDIAQFLASVISKVIIVQEVARPNIYWPTMGINTIGTLKPGRAYLVKVNAVTSVTYSSTWLNCDQSDYKLGLISEPEIKHPWNKVITNPSGHYIVFPSHLLSSFKPGDVIGAFNQSGICAGISSVNDLNNNLALIVFADDPGSLEIDGFSDGEVLSFKVFHQHNNSIEDFYATYDFSMPDFTGKFSTGGMSAIKSISTGTSGEFENRLNQLIITPNPASESITISPINPSGISEISVFNTSGQLISIFKVFANDKIDISHLATGVYYIKVDDQNSSRSQKLVIQK